MRVPGKSLYDVVLRLPGNENCTAYETGFCIDHGHLA